MNDDARAKCPYELILGTYPGPELELSIVNRSAAEAIFICDDYWGGTRLEIEDDDGKILSWKNIFPPVTPVPPVYNFLGPGKTYIANRAKIELVNDTYYIHWAKAQGFTLPSGNYRVRARWHASLETGGIPSRPFRQGELERQWTGVVEAQPLILILL